MKKSSKDTAPSGAVYSVEYLINIFNDFKSLDSEPIKPTVGQVFEDSQKNIFVYGEDSKWHPIQSFTKI